MLNKLLPVLFFTILPLLGTTCRNREEAPPESPYDHVYEVVIEEPEFWDDASRENGLLDKDEYPEFLNPILLDTISPTSSKVKRELEKISQRLMIPFTKENLPHMHRRHDVIYQALEKELSSYVYQTDVDQTYLNKILEDEHILLLSTFKCNLIFKTPYGRREYKGLIYVKYGFWYKQDMTLSTAYALFTPTGAFPFFVSEYTDRVNDERHETS